MMKIRTLAGWQNRLALPLLANLSLIPTLAFAAETAGIEELVITASPHGKTREETAGSLNILAGESLQRQVAATLGETLKNELGINSSSFGPGVGLPVIRGLSGKRVAILQNSSPVGDASASSPDHAVAVEPILADRIEILRGPATLRYGPGAIGGVVNIIDNRIHTTPVTGFAGAGETRYDNNGEATVTVGRIDGGNGTYSFHASGVTRDSGDIEIPGMAATDADHPDETTDGFVDNTDAKADAWSLGFSRVGEDVIVGFGVSKLNNNYGIPAGSHAHEEHEEHEEHEDTLNTRIDMDQTEYSAKVLLPNLPGNLNQWRLDLSHTDYRHRELEVIGTSASTGTRYATRTDNLRSELSFGSAESWLGAVGIQYSNIDFIAVGEEAFVPPNRIQTAGLFATQEHDMGPGTLSFGLRIDRQEAEADSGGKADHSLVNGAVSYLLPLGDAHQLSINASHSQRAPSAEELFALGEHVATSSFQVGDASLSREQANSLEITWNYSGRVDVNTSLYHRDFSNFLYEATNGSRFSHDLAEEGADPAALCSSDLADFDNSSDEFSDAVPCYFYRESGARFSGIEAELSAQLNDLTAVRLWGDSVRARLDEGGDVPRIPAARIGADVDVKSGLWALGLSFSQGFAQDRPGDLETPTDSYSRLDAYINLGNEQWTLFLKGSNLTDEDIRNATSFLRNIAPEPGRSIILGARVSF